MASIFVKIIRGEIPSYRVFENEHVYAFLTLGQIQLGHTLVVPKIEVDHFTDVPEPYYTSVFKTAKFISKAIHRATGSKRVGLAVVGLEVPHFHVHLVPLFAADDLDFRKGRPRDKQDCLEIQEKIIGELNKLIL